MRWLDMNHGREEGESPMYYFKKMDDVYNGNS